MNQPLYFSSYKHLIGLCLLVMYVFTACKKHEETTLPQPDQLSLVKAWYKTTSTQHKNKSARLTGADTIWYYFEPQWNDTQTEILPDGKRMLIVPLVRPITVKYSQTIGYIRRLLVHLNENGTVEQGYIAELFGERTQVREQERTLFKAGQQTTLPIAFKGAIIYYTPQYERLWGSHYIDGTAIAEAYFEPKAKTVAAKTKSSAPQNPIYIPFDWGLYWGLYYNGGGGGGNGNNTPQAPVSVLTSEGEGGGVGGNPPPIPENEYPYELTPVEIDPYYSSGTIDIGNNTALNPPIPDNISPELAAITDPVTYIQKVKLKDQDFEAVDKALQQGLKNPALKKAHQYMKDSSIRVVWTARGGVKGYAVQRSETVDGKRLLVVYFNPVVFKPENKDKLAIVLWEEILHTCQDEMYGESNLTLHPSNVEFEAKLLLELLNVRSDKALFGDADTALYEFRELYDEFKTWLKSVLANPSQANFATISATYWMYAEKFRAAYAKYDPNHPYASPLDQNFLPLLLFFLLN